MDWLKLGIGAYLALPGLEDWGPHGVATVPASAAIGLGLMASALGWD